MAWPVECEVPEALRRRVALRDVLRVAVRDVLRAAARGACGVAIAGVAADRGVTRFVTSLCRRSSRGVWWLSGVRWLAARAARTRSPFVCELAASASGLVAVLLGRGGDG